MSAFDLNSFLDTTMTEALVKRPPLPVGDYVAIIGDPEMRPWVSKSDPTKSGVACDYQLTIDVPYETQQAMGVTDLPTVKVKHGLMLDVMPDGKGLDMSPGKNAGLRRLREALDMNTPGQPFNLRLAAGRVVTVKIGHREYPEGSGDLFEEVLGLAKA